MDYLKKDCFSSLHDFPQHLCKMCGECCKAITTPFSFEELEELALKGQEEARVFLDVFKKYDTIEDAKKAAPCYVENILNELVKNNPTLDTRKVTFYYCPHLSADNLCKIYQTRPDCCRRAPRNGWTLFPMDCGFRGWQFVQREKSKAYIRKIKEFILELELLPPDTFIENRKMVAKDLIKFLNDEIKSFKKYGSEQW